MLKPYYNTLPYFVSDNVSSMFGSTEEYDISMWPWNLSDVWRPNVGMPDMQKNCRTKDLTILKSV